MRKKIQRTDEDKYVSYDKTNGKYKLRMPNVKAMYFATKEEAIEERRKQQAIQNMESGQYLDTSTTFAEWVELYLNQYCTCRPGIKSDYQRLLENCVDESLWDKRLVDIKKSDLNGCLRYLMRKGRAVSSIRKAKAVLVTVFNVIIDNELLPRELLPNLNLLKITDGCTTKLEEEKRAFPTKTLAKLIDAANDISKNAEKCLKFKAIITLLIYTGMRRSEVLGICKNNIEVINENTVHIKVRTTSHDGAGTPWYISTVKAKRSKREFDVTVPGLGNLIQQILDVKHPAAIYEGQSYDLLFATKTGSPISERNFTREFVRIRNKAGLDVKCHELRHSYATLLATNNTPYLAAAKRLGHSPEMYLKRYGHVYDESLDQIDKLVAEQSAKDAETDAK